MVFIKFYFSEIYLSIELKRRRLEMKPGGWYLIVFVTTFIYFYIYAVNYVRGAKVPPHPDELKTHYLEAEAQEHLDRIVREVSENARNEDIQISARQGVQQPLFPRLSMQYHNYTRLEE